MTPETQNKLVNTVLFISKKLDGKTTFHKLFKILYFAEMRHLTEYGHSITGDNFIAMPFGPVPSKLYDLLKSINIKVNKSEIIEYSSLIKVSGTNIESVGEPDLDDLSESEILAISNAIEDNRHLSFKDLSNKSHDFAWSQAKTCYSSNRIALEDIAKVGGANDVMINYIKINQENARI